MALARLLAEAAKANGKVATSLTTTTSSRLVASHASNYCQPRHGYGLINNRLNGPNATLARFSSSAAQSKSPAATSEGGGGQEVAVQSSGEGRRSKWKSLLPRRFQRGRRNNSLWRNDPRDIAPSPFFGEFFPPNLGNALLEATQNINRLFDTLSPSQLIGRIKERDDSYKLRFEVPGLSKEDIKITVDNGVLNIRGEHKEEQKQHPDEGASDESEDEFEFYSSRSYYNSSLVLPEDVKEDGIKAELKNGVLNVIVPKDEKKAKEVKEIEIH